MKIVQVASYYPPHTGGMQNCVKAISEALAKKGHKVEVFASNIACENKKIKSTKNLKINYLKSFELCHTAIIPSLFLKLLKIPKDTIIHLHIAHAFVPEIVWLVCKIRKMKFIAHFHSDVMASGTMGILLPLYKKVFLKRVLNSASKVIIPTLDYSRIVKEKYFLPKKKIVVIPNGINLNKINPTRRKNKLNKKIKLLFVGNLSRVKNIPMLIKAFEIFLKKGYDSRLTIVGGGDEKQKLINLVRKKGLENKVIFQGRLSGKKLHKIYQNSDIFVFPSKKESFGLVLLEAMAFGIPIIASDIPGVRNIVKINKSALLVKMSAENFAQEITKINNNKKLREKLVKNALKEVKKYSWVKIINQFENIYEYLKKTKENY